MKTIFFISVWIVAFAFSSCIKDEALNAEADIITATVPEEILKVDPLIENNRITFRVKSNTDLTLQAPEFTLSEGATVKPVSGIFRDFTKPQMYTVTSEDGQWEKKYTVSFIISELSFRYGFEYFRLDENNKYHVFYEINNAGENIMDWGSGNAGFAITAGETPAHLYPTTYAETGLGNHVLKLSTQRTGPLGAMFFKPIAAGNIFMGNFDVGAALSSPLKAVKMGVPFEQEPEKLRGYFKYASGDTYIQVVKNDEGKTVIEEFENKEIPDGWDIYAIFYDNNEGKLILDGTNKFTHENLVSVARIDQQDAIETEEWTEFEIPFEQKTGKTIDKQKLNNGGYNVSIVITSSIDGDYFKGAENSTLLIDDLEIIYHK